jgi:type III secretory pathway lipoprotein EscJ
MSAVTLTVVHDEAEANVVCGFLRANGIKCSYRNTDMPASVWPIGSTSPIEVVVEESEFASAQKVLERRTR